MRGVGAGRSAKRGTSAATTGPRGARSAPPNPERVRLTRPGSRTCQHVELGTRSPLEAQAHDLPRGEIVRIGEYFAPLSIDGREVRIVLDKHGDVADMYELRRPGSQRQSPAPASVCKCHDLLTIRGDCDREILRAGLT